MDLENCCGNCKGDGCSKNYQTQQYSITGDYGPKPEELNKYFSRSNSYRI